MVRWQRCAPQIQGLAQQGLCFAPIAPSLKVTSKRIQRLWRMALLELCYPLRKPHPDKFAPADGMAFLIIQCREQNIGKGLARWHRIDEEGCAVGVSKPFMQGFVKKC